VDVKRESKKKHEVKNLSIKEARKEINVRSKFDKSGSDL